MKNSSNATRPQPHPHPLTAASEWSWRFIIIVAGIGLAVYILVYLKIVVLPVILALFLATLLVPPVNWLVRRRWNRALATTAVFMSSLLLIAGLGLLIGPMLGKEVDNLQKDVGQGVTQVTSWLADGPLKISQAQIDDTVEQSSEWLRQNSSRVTGGIFSGAAIVAEILAGFLLTLVLLFFYMKDGPAMWRWLVKLFPAKRRDYVERFGRNGWDTLGAYLRGLSVIAAVDAVLIGIVLLVLGVPLVLPLVILVFFGAFLPLIGAFISGLAAVLVALVAQGPLVALGVLAAIIIIQQLEGDVLYPIVVGRNVELHAVAILLAVTAGAVAGGVIGAFLAVPLAAVAYAEFLHLRRPSTNDDTPKKL